MTWKELADKIETDDYNDQMAAFTWMVGGEDAEDARAMVVRALRFADHHDVTLPKDLPKS